MKLLFLGCCLFTAFNMLLRKTAKIFHRKFPEIFKRTILQNPGRKTSVVDYGFNKIPEIESRPAILLKKKLTPRRSSSKYMKTCSTFSERSDVNSVLGKIAHYAL